MTRLLISIAMALCCTLGVMAQELQVRSFTQLPDNRMDILSDPEYDNENKLCALIQVEVVPECTFSGSILQRDHHQVIKRKASTYWLYMPTGKGRGLLDELKIESPGYLPLTVHYDDYGITLESGKTYVLTIVTTAAANTVPVQPSVVTPTPSVPTSPSMESTSSFHAYIGVAYQVGSLTGMGADLGADISGFNIEAGIAKGTAKEAYCVYASDGSNLRQSEADPMRMHGKLGYTIAIGNTLRLTPQLGVGLLLVSDDIVADNANALSALVGVRAAICLGKSFQIVLSPEYAVPVSKSVGYDALSAISGIDAWSSGFNIKAGIAVAF